LNLVLKIRNNSERIATFYYFCVKSKKALKGIFLYFFK
jgi:hypothetical protein